MIKIGGNSEKYDDNEYTEYSDIVGESYKGYPTFMSWWNSNKIVDKSDIIGKNPSKKFLERWKNIENYDSYIKQDELGYFIDNKIVKNQKKIQLYLIENLCTYIKSSKFFINLESNQDITIISSDYEGDEALVINENTYYNMNSVLYLIALIVFFKHYYMEITINLKDSGEKKIIIDKNTTIKSLKQKYDYDVVEIDAKEIDDDMKLYQLKGILDFSRKPEKFKISIIYEGRPTTTYIYKEDTYESFIKRKQFHTSKLLYYGKVLENQQNLYELYQKDKNKLKFYLIKKQDYPTNQVFLSPNNISDYLSHVQDLENNIFVFNFSDVLCVDLVKYKHMDDDFYNAFMKSIIDNNSSLYNDKDKQIFVNIPLMKDILEKCSKKENRCFIIINNDVEIKDVQDYVRLNNLNLKIVQSSNKPESLKKILNERKLYYILFKENVNIYMFDASSKNLDEYQKEFKDYFDKFIFCKTSFFIPNM